VLHKRVLHIKIEMFYFHIRTIFLAQIIRLFYNRLMSLLYILFFFQNKIYYQH